MAKIGFLGLGEMGTPMCARLLGAGHELVVWNRSVERTARLAEKGAAVAATPANAAAGRDFLITMLATRRRSSRCSSEARGWRPRSCRARS